MSLCFFGRGYIYLKGRFKFSKLLRVVTEKGWWQGHVGGGGLGDLKFFWGGKARQKEVRSKLEGEAHTLEDTVMNFWQVINQNVEKKQKKNVHKQISIGVTDISKFYKVFVHIVKVDSVFKKQRFRLYSLYMHETLPTLGNQKEQKQIKFWEKSLGELIFSWATKYLKMFYFNCPTGRVFKK